MIETAEDVIKSIVNGEVRVLAITQGKFVVVDREDYDDLKDFNWNALKHPGRDGVKYYYCARRIKRCEADKHSTSRIFMHREVLKAGEGKIPDHVNGIGLDNRRCNLREATVSQNAFNSGSRKGRSKYKGICLHKATGKWSAKIRCDGKLKWLGLFEDEVKAAKAYDKAAFEYAGAYAYLNFPDEAACQKIFVKNVNTWGDLQCPQCGTWVIRKKTVQCYISGTFSICPRCKEIATLDEELCKRANEIIQERLNSSV